MFCEKEDKRQQSCLASGVSCWIFGAPGLTLHQPVGNSLQFLQVSLSLSISTKKKKQQLTYGKPNVKAGN